MSNYYGRNPERVQFAPNDDDAALIERIEIDFAIPVWLSVDQQRRLAALVSEIAQAPENTPRDGVHWLSGYGDKPVLSARDAALLGKRQMTDEVPADGEEPRWESEVLYFETCARPR